MMMYRVAKASEYIAITGTSIKDVKVVKKAWILPGQRCRVFDITPVNYTFDVQAMSVEKLPFILPAVFTIGPVIDDMGALQKYAKLIAPHDKRSNHVTELVKGVIEGETRVLAASMTMEEIFKGTKQFKKEVFEKVQLELHQFGLIIYNANVKQLVDVPGHEYFSYLGQKTQQEAANQAKVDVAEAKFKGDTGAKVRQGLTSQNAAKVDAESRIYSKQQTGLANQQEAKIEAETKVYENETEAKIAEANANLEKKKAEWKRQYRIAQIEATKIAEIKEAELQKEVEMKKVLAETERLRASILSKAKVEYEAGMEAANAKLYSKQKEADAVLYASQREAEARQKAADATLYAKQREAEGELYAKIKQAEAIKVLGEAHATYVKAMLMAFGGNTSAFHDYLMIDRGLYQEMGRVNASALQGLQPKISLWNTNSAKMGGEKEGEYGGMEQLSGIFKMIPPLLTTVKEQTGINPPSWVATMPIVEEANDVATHRVCI